MHLAIIGSGPSGCYMADSLLRLAPDASIDVLERLPVPFGLVRYGVAPDHQSTKGVTRVLDRVLSRDRVAFFGNVEVGRDVRMEELLSLYDAVVLATGACRDRQLGLPGEGLPGVLGSGAFTGWYNAHPDSAVPAIDTVRAAVVIGNGNVALDVARILAKDRSELVGSDLTPETLAWLCAQPLENIHVVGRRTAADAKFTEHELEELGTLSRARVVVPEPASLQGESKMVDVLRRFAEDRRETPVSISFHFQLTPVAFVGEERLTAVQFRDPAGALQEIPAQLAVTCIGYESVACCSIAAANGSFANNEGKIRDGLYVVGWAKRGPSGTIPTNRSEAQGVAQRIAQEVSAADKPGGGGLRELLQRRGVAWVDYSGWRAIEAAERTGACNERCRLKFTKIEHMLEAARSVELRTA